MSLYSKLKHLKSSLGRIPTDEEILPIIEESDESNGLCYICGHKAKAKDLCGKHHAFVNRNNIDINNKLEIKKFIIKVHKDFKFIRNNTCLVCSNSAKIKGLCPKHYSYIIKHKNEVDMNNPDIMKKFILENCIEFRKKRGCYICGKAIQAHNLCKSHVNYAYNHNLNVNDKEAVKSYIYTNHSDYKSKSNLVKIENILNKGEHTVDELIRDYEIVHKCALTKQEQDIFLYAYITGKLHTYKDLSNKLNNI